MGPHPRERHRPIPALGSTVRGIFRIARDIGHGKGGGRRPGNFRFNPQSIVPHDDTEIGHFTPVGAPGIATDPIGRLGGLVVAPADNGDNVIDQHMPDGSIIDNATFIRQERIGIDGGRHGSARVNFRLYFGHHPRQAIGIIGVSPVLRQSGVGELLDGKTLAGGIAGATDIEGSARGIQVGTKAVGGIVTASEVGHTGLVGNKAGFLENELVDPRGRAAVTRTSGLTGAIQNVLNGQVDFIAAEVVYGPRTVASGNANAIRQAAERAVGPTGAAVL
jgi:hypothetical protein